ncbi:hypothetical protein ACFL1H_05110 [Nanoarchaeota archaeon]
MKRIIYGIGVMSVLGGCGGGGGGATPSIDESAITVEQQQSIARVIEDNQVIHLDKYGTEFLKLDKNTLINKYSDNPDLGTFINEITDGQPISYNNAEISDQEPQMNITFNNIFVYVKAYNPGSGLIETRPYPLVSNNDPNDRTYFKNRFKVILPQVMDNNERGDDIFSPYEED